VIKFVSDLQQVGGSPGTPVSSISKTDRHGIPEILLNVALNTIPHSKQRVFLVCVLFIVQYLYFELHLVLLVTRSIYFSQFGLRLLQMLLIS